LARQICPNNVDSHPRPATVPYPTAGKRLQPNPHSILDLPPTDQAAPALLAGTTNCATSAGHV